MSWKWFYGFIAFGCLGMTAEIFFTALTDLYSKWINAETMDLKLQGKSYIWMFFIYGLAAVFFPLLYAKLMHLPLLVRLLIAVLIIFMVEYITGWMLDMFTGRCPWEYTTGWHISGYIRLDYAPAWMFFAFLLEKVYLFWENSVHIG